MVQYVPLLLMALVGLLVFGLALLLGARGKAASVNDGTVASAVLEQRGFTPLPTRYAVGAMAGVISLLAALVVVLWAVASPALGGFGLVVVIVASVALLSALVFFIGSGTLSWGPVRLPDDDNGEQTITKTPTADSPAPS